MEEHGTGLPDREPCCIRWPRTVARGLCQVFRGSLRWCFSFCTPPLPSLLHRVHAAITASSVFAPPLSPVQLPKVLLPCRAPYACLCSLHGPSCCLRQHPTCPAFAIAGRLGSWRAIAMTQGRGVVTWPAVIAPGLETTAGTVQEASGEDQVVRR